MAKHSRNRGRSISKKTRKRSEPELYDHDGVVIDINAFASHPPGKYSSSRNHHPLIQARNPAQGHYLADFLGRGVVECAIKNERIVFEPLAYMRGKTFEDAFVVLDEAQNCTRLQLKMFLTRIGECARVVVNGDTHQTDIGNGSGLVDAATRLHGLDNVCIHEFETGDIVRSKLVRDIIQRYETG